MVALSFKGLLFSLFDSEFETCRVVVVIIRCGCCIATDMVFACAVFKSVDKSRESRYTRLPRRCGLRAHVQP